MSQFAAYIVPLLFLYFGAGFLFRKPKYKDQSGLSTRRAKESEEIWDYVQRIGGICCFVFAAVTAGTVYYINDTYGGAEGNLFWVEVGVNVACIALLIPVVNLITNLKFPKK